MTEPTVCAVMLTADRPEMARRAVECFRAQTYVNKRLVVLDNGSWKAPHWLCDREKNIRLSTWNPDHPDCKKRTIGDWRNIANGGAVGDLIRLDKTREINDVEILIHWDDDDFSHPDRIAEQVALLQSSGADCVGYREMLFWRESEQVSHGEIYGGKSKEPWDVIEPQAWLYSNPNPSYALGTSLAYWRKTWERKPFEAVNAGEDTRWITGLKVETKSSIPARSRIGYDPRMIARIHAGNTSKAYDPAVMRAVERQGGEWKRVPKWDSYCRSTMEAN